MFCSIPFGFGSVAIPQNGSLQMLDTQITPTNANSAFTFFSDGSCIASSSNNPTVNGKWFSAAPQTGVGAGYWIKFTLSSGDAWTAGLVAGTLYQLNSNRSIGWNTSNGIKQAIVTASIYSDSGGTNLVATWTIDAYVESLP